MQEAFSAAHLALLFAFALLHPDVWRFAKAER
jgi:hypothetical protein